MHHTQVIPFSVLGNVELLYKNSIYSPRYYLSSLSQAPPNFLLKQTLSECGAIQNKRMSL